MFDEVEESDSSSVDSFTDSDLDDSFEMAESSVLAPPMFSGRSDQDPENLFTTIRAILSI